MICPQCRSAACFRSRRGGVLDFLGTVVGLRPWRCDTCDRRFYARRVAISFSTYAHCPRCGNFDLEPLPGYAFFADADIAHVHTLVSRTGYSGEDGFELMCEAGTAETVWSALLDSRAAASCG